MVASWWADQTTPASSVQELKYSEFMSRVTAGTVTNIVLDESERLITGNLTSGGKFKVVMPVDEKLVDTLVDRNISFEAKQPERGSIWKAILVNTLPLVLFIGVWIYLMRQMQGGGGKGAMSFGKSRARGT